MPPFETIAAILAAYVAIAVLLLSLNLVSRWRLWVKVSAIVLCGVFFVVSYIAINSLLGWPSSERVPDRFNLLATRIVEPNRRMDEAGSIFFWLERIDDDNVPSGQPLSYRIPYSDDLARAADRAQALIDQGAAVEAMLREVVGDEAGSGTTNMVAGDNPGQGSGGAGEHVEGVNLVFNNMPPVRLPGKGPL